MARLSTSTTRNAKLGLAAAAMLAATSLGSPTRADEPGRAGVSKIDGLPAQCLKAGNELAQYKCGSAYYRKMRADAEARSADAKVRGAAAEKQTSTANASTQCMERVAQEAGDPKKLSSEQKAAVRAKILSCG